MSLQLQVMCDRCGMTAGRTDPLFRVSESAREHSARIGWQYDNAGHDLCAECTQLHGGA